MPERHDTFASVERLDDSGLRQLLLSGDSSERVWAAWALGLRLGDDVTELVRPAIGSEPDPGVRAHLVVMLAGANELQAVQEMAGADGDPDVRATACAYLHRLARDRDDAMAAFLAHRLRSETSWVVRKRLVGLNAERGFLQDPELGQAMQDSDVSVRREAFRVVDDDQFARLVDATWSRFTDPTRESDSELRAQFLGRVLELEGIPGAMRRIAASGGASDEAWRGLRHSGLTAEWDQLAFLADGTPDNEARLVELLAVGSDVRAIEWLVRSMLQPSAISTEALSSLARLDATGSAALAEVVGGLSQADRTLVQARVYEKVQEWRDYLLEEDEDQDEEGAEWLADLDRLSKAFSG